MDNEIYAKLNEMQKQAVLTTAKNILVTAGAGSGKTRVLTERIINLINCKYVHPQQILAITFTNKASNVMKERLQEKGLNTQNMWISTFHSCCVRILRENASKLCGYNSNFTIFDETDKNKVISNILKTSSQEYADDFKKTLSFHISHYKNKYQTLEEYKNANSFERDIDDIVEFIKQYEKILQENNAFDFDDLLFKAFKLLKENDDVKEYYNQKFKHILVDEFQDTNEIQYDLIKLLCGKDTSVFVVGDEDQCIYTWRGANYKNIANFTKDFDSVEIIKLEQNYRSTKKIIEGANKIISKNFERIDKKLWTDNEDGLKIEYKKCYNESEEADYVASTIYSLSSTNRESLNNIAVLVRLNSLTRNIEEKLLNYGINYKVYGGMKFYDRVEIKSFLAYLKVLNNTKDDVSFSKIANFPKRGIGDASIENLKKINLSKSMLENLLELNQSCGIKGATFNKLYSLKLLFEDLLQKKDELDLVDLTEYIIEKINLENYLNVVEEDKNRMLNIEQLVLSIKEFCKNNNDATLSTYLQSVTLVSDMDSYNEDEECVTIATVHASKGLEFECVFVVGLEDGIFPLKRNDDCDEEEERRLMYVAVTRAMKRLYLSSAKERFLYGFTRHEIVSTYVKDLGFEQPIFDKNRYIQNSSNFGESSYNKKYSQSAGFGYKYDSGVESFANAGTQSIKTATEIKAESVNLNEFSVGDRVLHNRYGEGLIISISGDTAKINFKGIGVKELMITIAPLKKLWGFMDRMKQLVEILNRHNYNYYVLDNPTISDKEWDKLYDELLSLEKQTGVVLENSPSKKVGDTVLKGFKKQAHKVPLFSLEKVNNYQDLEKWILDIKSKVKDAKFSLDYKYDGLSCVLTYKNGLLVNALTRGNGQVGEDVTQQVKTIRTVPLSIDFKGEVVVQGECIMKLSELEKYNKTATEVLKNARNAAAGGLRNLDPKITKSRNLDVICYSVNFIEGKTFKTQQEMQEFLRQNKFYVVEHFKVEDNFENIKHVFENIDVQRRNLDFLIDGAVLKLDNVSEREKLGYTIKFPKWAIAFKFEAEETSTILKQVVWTVGRTGKITPGAIVEPVELAGATITKATLNNYEDILRKKVMLNSRVFIRRSNEVIPEILGLAEKFDNSTEIEKPKVCPSCGTELLSIGPNLFCLNTYSCPKQIKEKIVHYCSREAMNIEGISDKTIDLFYDKLNVRSVADLYDLKYEQIIELENFKHKKTQNILDAIEKSKNIPLSKFIFAIGILNVGKKTARDLAKTFKTFENFRNASFESLTAIDDIGEIVANSILDYFANEKNIVLINKIFEKGVNVQGEENQDIKTENYFYGKKIVLTGTLENYKREELSEILLSFGADVVTSVSKNTNLVICGKDAGSKLAKAQSLNIKTINEEELLELLKNIQNTWKFDYILIK